MVQDLPWQQLLYYFVLIFHQISEDKKHGKNSPLVRLGAKKGSQFVPWIIFTIYIFQLFTIINGFIPVFCILYLISFPQAIRLINLLKSSYKKHSAIKNSKFIEIKFQTLNGVGLITGLIFCLLYTSDAADD